jgi:hypothetical protein
MTSVSYMISNWKNKICVRRLLFMSNLISVMQIRLAYSSYKTSNNLSLLILQVVQMCANISICYIKINDTHRRLHNRLAITFFLATVIESFVNTSIVLKGNFKRRFYPYFFIGLFAIGAAYIDSQKMVVFGYLETSFLVAMSIRVLSTNAHLLALPNLA